MHPREGGGEPPGREPSGAAGIPDTGVSPPTSDMAELRFRLLVESAPMGVWFSEPESGVVYTNAQLQQHLGLSEEATLGWSLIEAIHPDDRERLASAVYRLWVEGIPFDEELRTVRPDGEERLLRARGRGLFDERGRVVGVVGTTEDVTEQRRAESLRRELVKRLVEMADRERAKLSDDLHNGAAQDLTASRILLERIEQRIADLDLRRDVAAVRSLLDRTMRDLRIIMRELSPPDLRTEGLSPAVRALARELEARTEIHIDVVDRLDSEPSREVRDVAYQLVQEALANVRRHADASRVLIEIFDSSGGLQIRVGDDGRSIAPEALESQVFDEPGISSMRDRVLAVGGRCDIRVGDQGTTVEFWIPTGEQSSLVEGA